MASSRDQRNRSNSQSVIANAVVRYGLAVVSVGLVVLLMQAIELPPASDVRPGFLVAVAASTLYGGLGPGLLALALVGLAVPDMAALVAGAALVTVCATFRHARTPSRAPAAVKDLSSSPPPQLERPEVALTGFAPEAPRLVPSFIEVTSEATWRFQHEQPLDITLPEADQIEHLYLYSVLAECNDAFAKMYGFRAAADVVGTRLVVFCPPANPENVAYLRSFIRSGYRLEDAESHEIDRYGNAKYFVNNLVGIFERGQLVGAWGTQRDVTATKQSDSDQEYLSRAHSTKSSSQ